MSPTPAAHPPPSPSRSAPPDVRYRSIPLKQCATYHFGSYPYFLVPQRLRIDHGADQLQLALGRKSRRFGLVQAVYLERSVFLHLLGRDPWMQRDRTHLRGGPVEVEPPEIGHPPVDVDEPVRRVVGVDLVPADARDDVDGIAEHPLRVVAHPVARRVVDGVARCAADAEHLSGRVLQRPE